MSTEETISEVQSDHEQRNLECKTLPKKRRGKRERLRPRTAIITYAAMLKTLRQLPNAPEIVEVALKAPRHERARVLGNALAKFR